MIFPQQVAINPPNNYLENGASLLSRTTDGACIQHDGLDVVSFGIREPTVGSHA